jgi:hypothetical protein
LVRVEPEPTIPVLLGLPPTRDQPLIRSDDGEAGSEATQPIKGLELSQDCMGIVRLNGIVVAPRV